MSILYIITKEAEGDDENELIIMNIYSTEEQANIRIEELRKSQAHFKYAGYSIKKYKLNESNEYIAIETIKCR